MKRFLKGMFFCITVLMIAGISGVASYIITSNILGRNPYNEKTETAKMQIPVAVGGVTAETDDEVSAEADTQTEFKHYTVKLEDDILNVYVNYKEHEELLFGEEINVGDLSTEDKEMLISGVKLEEMSKVTELTENFTS